MFDINFWKRDYIKRFNLDREGQEILGAFISADEKKAEEFIKDKYERTVYRGDIIDTYCDKYDNVKINELLKNFEYDSLSEDEIKNFDIRLKEEKIKPKCALIGEDGNIFNLMGIASRTLKRNNMSQEAKEMCDRITSSKSYDEALCIIGEYVEITDQAGLEDVEEFE